MVWEIKEFNKIPRLHNAILIEGLPGIGNVGKLTVDFLVEELKAKKIYDFFSYSMPHSVFVTEDNLVSLPRIELYYAVVNNKPLLLLSGDTQPIDEVSSYQFSEEILSLAQKLGVSEVITIGGIGLSSVPKNPQVFCTGNSKDIVMKYKKGTQLNNKIFGVVGPIIGVSGLLVGLSTKRKMKAVSLLAETYGHPLYVGLRGAKEVVNVLNSKLGLNLNTKKIDREISKIELPDEGSVGEEILDKGGIIPGLKGGLDTNYIG